MPTPGYIPGPLVIPLTFQVRLVWTLPNSKQATNVLHCIVGDELNPSVALADSIFDAIIPDTVTPEYFAFLSGTTALQFLDIRDIPIANQPEVHSTGDFIPSA